MKTHKKQLALVIAALLTGSTLAISNVWADSKKSSSSSEEARDAEKAAADAAAQAAAQAAKDQAEKEAQAKAAAEEEAAKKAGQSDKSDSDLRSTKSGEANKITVCHIPPGNPGNKHTIHIGASAWPAHRDNHGDYLGSCNNPPARKDTSDTARSVAPSAYVSTTQKETLYSIIDCPATQRQTLLEVTQAYFEPIVVSEDAMQDEAVITAMSNCLDGGDSSDSGKGDSSAKKRSSNQKTGAGHDSVSDSGKHHVIRGCKNKGQGKADSHGGAKKDDSTNHLAQLDAAVAAFNAKSPEASSKRINIISDSSMDDSGVRKEYKDCMKGHKEDSDSSKHKSDSHAGYDSAKIHKNKGDSGHKYREVRGCSNADAIQAAVDAHHAEKKDAKKWATRPILVNSSSLTDVVVKAAVDACEKAGAKKVELPPNCTDASCAGTTPTPGADNPSGVGPGTTPSGNAGGVGPGTTPSGSNAGGADPSGHTGFEGTLNQLEKNQR